MRKKLLRPIALSLLWLCFGLSCKKEEPEPKSCKDGTCCGLGKQEYRFYKTIAGEPADLLPDNLGNGIAYVAFQNDLRDKEGIYALKGALLCDLSANKVQQLKASATFSGPFTYKHRVWGRVYYLNILTTTGKPIDYIYITRIE